MMTSSNGSIFCVTNPLCGEYSGHRWISIAKAIGAELWCFYLRLSKRLSKQSWQWWFETPSPSLWHHCNDNWAARCFTQKSPCSTLILIWSHTRHNHSLTSNVHITASGKLLRMAIYFSISKNHARFRCQYACYRCAYISRWTYCEPNHVNWANLHGISACKWNCIQHCTVLFIVSGFTQHQVFPPSIQCKK